ncbi:MAG TPA: AmmeMemoRadiSam system protein B [Acidimicrobiales bacterium]|nr:AmmeMemoRadiSam system protein B [Acidimicrobiales bacterium]
MRVRPPAVAGRFYPADARALRSVIAEQLGEHRPPPPEIQPLRPKAIVVPHAGYVFSGRVAASAFALLRRPGPPVERVVLLGPAHTVALEGMAVSSADVWETPLGTVPVDSDCRDRLAARPHVAVDDRPHTLEHSLEVEVPFLQSVLAPGWTLVPIVVGNARPEWVADALDCCWGGDETLIVVSTDMSHFEPDARAREHDHRTALSVLASRDTDIGTRDACGARPLKGLIVASRRHGLQPELVDTANSADAGADPDRVVGYASFAYEPVP